MASLGIIHILIHIHIQGYANASSIATGLIKVSKKSRLETGWQVIGFCFCFRFCFCFWATSGVLCAAFSRQQGQKQTWAWSGGRGRWAPPLNCQAERVVGCWKSYCKQFMCNALPMLLFCYLRNHAHISIPSPSPSPSPAPTPIPTKCQEQQKQQQQHKLLIVCLILENIWHDVAISLPCLRCGPFQCLAFSPLFRKYENSTDYSLQH